MMYFAIVDSSLANIHTLHRYFLWANRLRNQMRSHLDEAEAKVAGKISALNFFSGHCAMFMSYWFATLFVIIEGYRALELSSSRLDSLLAQKDNVDLLRRYRNGIFHFQPGYFDARVTELLDQADVALPWAEDVHSEFSEFFLREIGEKTGLLPGLDDLAKEMVATIREAQKGS